jgi:hypothetical protein
VTLSACSAPTDAPAPARSSATVAAAAPPACPNPDGGACVGALQAGKAYATSAFAPAISYSVAGRGWTNDEDLPGNFLLLPPRNSLPGVNAGTSDFIGVYSSVVAERFTHLPSCATESVADVADTPGAVSSWLRRQPGVIATPPVAVTVGGLHGLRTDLALDPHVAAPRCTDDATGAVVRYRPILLGQGASGLDHGLIPDLAMRLYLLVYKGGVLAIEVDDVATAPGTLASLSAVAETLRFASA